MAPAVLSRSGLEQRLLTLVSEYRKRTVAEYDGVSLANMEIVELKRLLPLSVIWVDDGSGPRWGIIPHRCLQEAGDPKKIQVKLSWDGKHIGQW